MNRTASTDGPEFFSGTAEPHPWQLVCMAWASPGEAGIRWPGSISTG